LFLQIILHHTTKFVHATGNYNLPKLSKCFWDSLFVYVCVCMCVSVDKRTLLQFLSTSGHRMTSRPSGFCCRNTSANFLESCHSSANIQVFWIPIESSDNL